MSLTKIESPNIISMALPLAFRIYGFSLHQRQHDILTLEHEDEEVHTFQMDTDVQAVVNEAVRHLEKVHGYEWGTT